MGKKERRAYPKAIRSRSPPGPEIQDPKPGPENQTRKPDPKTRPDPNYCAQAPWSDIITALRNILTVPP